MHLAKLREKINRLDAQIIPLLEQRMDCARSVATVKTEQKLSVLQKEREKEVLEQVASVASEYPEEIQWIYQSILDSSRFLQYQAMPSPSPETLVPIVASPKKATPTLACQGIEGAYSFLAGHRLFPNASILPHRTFADVFRQVAEGSVDYGILPVENSHTGSIHESYDLIMEHKLYIVGAIELPVSHCLAAQPGATLASIQTVYSHPQGLLQCTDFIHLHHYHTVSVSNTAIAAKSAAEQQSKTVAAIASETAARQYGLEILAKGIQSNHNNATRFIAVSKQLELSEDANKISLLFSLPHQTGALHSILSWCSFFGLNLTKIESRPKKDSRFQYLFYLDMLGNLKTKPFLQFLSILQEEMLDFSFLGNYRELE